MLVIFHPDATAKQIEAVLLRIEQTGAGAQRVDGAEQTVVGVIDADRDHIAGLELDADAGVDRVVRSPRRTSSPASTATGGARTRCGSAASRSAARTPRSG
jgi:hypothetical protein